LLGAEVRAGEDLLHAEDLHALAPRLLDQVDMLSDVRVSDRIDRFLRTAGMCRLYEAALYDSWHLKKG
jgi:hypothetical protein